MKIQDLDPNVAEPVTLDEVKDYMGLPSVDETFDDMLNRNIRAMREVMEGELDRIISMRTFAVYPDVGPITKLPTPLQEIVSFKACFSDDQGQSSLVDVEYELCGDEWEPRIYWKMPEGCTNPVLTVLCGFDDAPECIRTAICDLVKAKNDRAPIAPVLVDAHRSCCKYRRVRL